jgi:hypothetical protein
MSALFFVGCSSSGTEDDCCQYDKAIQSLGNSIPPVATILSNFDTVKADENIDIKGKGDDRDGTIKEYSWKIDGIEVSKDSEFTTSLKDIGKHNICLAVTDNDNLKSKEVCTDITVLGDQKTLIPTAIITVTENNDQTKELDGLPVNKFVNFDCRKSHDNDKVGEGDEIQECIWNIKSYTSTNQLYRTCATNVNIKVIEGTHVCESPAYVDVVLKVIDNDGEVHTTSKTYQIIR